jgi:1,4-alpha-glucan branching enzyme
MKLWVGIASLVLATACWAQESGTFQPSSSTNVWGAEYPRVDNAGRVQIRVKAPDATKVRLNFWNGPKMDMEKQGDGFWTVTTPPLAPGALLHVDHRRRRSQRYR